MGTFNEHKKPADTALWPRSLDDLSRTDICPSCQRPLRATVCAFCGLDLGHPASVELMSMSVRAADALTRRLVIMQQIRTGTSATSDTSPSNGAISPEHNVAPLTVVEAGEPSDSHAHQLVDTEPPDRSARTVPPARTGRSVRSGVSSVQVALLITGVSLLSAGAVAFLVYAFLNYGIVSRSVIIGSVTIAAFAAATVLLKKRLRATAEGIAIFAMVLVYLDAWAVRSNDFFGAASANPALFWGTTLVGSSIAFVVWSRLTLAVESAAAVSVDGPGPADPGGAVTVRWLRAPHLIGWTALPLGVALLADAAVPADVGEAPFYAFAAMIATGLAHPLATIRHNGAPIVAAKIERTVLLSIAALSVIPALVSALFVPNASIDNLQPSSIADAAVPLTAIAAIAALALLHVMTALRSTSTPGGPAWSALFAAITGPALLTASAAIALASDELVPPIAALAVVASAVALIIERSSPNMAPAFKSAAASAAIVAVGAGLVPVVVAIERIGVALSTTATSGLRADVELVLARPTPDSTWSVSALALIVVIAAMVWGSRPMGSRLQRLTPVAWSGAAVAILAVPLLTTLTGMLIGWLTLAVLSLIALIRIRFIRRRGEPDATHTNWVTEISPPLRPVFATLGLVAVGLGWLISWANTTTWIVATLLTIALLVTARCTTSNDTARALLLATASVVLVIAAATTPSVIAFIRLDIASAGVAGDSARLVAVVAALLIAVSVLTVEKLRLSSLDRRVTFWIGFTVSVLVWLALESGITLSSASDTRDLAAARLAVAALLLAALIARVVRRDDMRAERMAASVALAPAVYPVVAAFAALTGLTDGSAALISLSVIAVTAGLLTALGSMVSELLRPHHRMRPLREVGVALVAVPAVASSIVEGEQSLWLVLVLAALILVALAVSRDGLVGSASGRRHLGWGAILLGTLALWVRLGETRVDEVEAFVLPVAGVMLLVAAAIHYRRPATAPAGSPSEGMPSPGSSPVPASATATPPAAAAPAATAAVTLIALLVALLPTAVASVSGEPPRALVVGGASVLLLLAGSFWRPRNHPKSSSRPLLDAVLLAGALGLLVTAVGRAAALSAQGNPDIEFDSWLVVLVGSFIAAGYGVAASASALAAPASSTSAFASASATAEPAARRDPRLRASLALVITALVAAALLESAAVLGDDGDDGTPLRAVITILTLCLIHVIAFLIDSSPLTRLVAWISIALAALVAAASISVGAVDPIEFVTVPIALSLLASGATRMLEDSTTRSWPWLGAGTALLLLPSLLATIGDSPIWRLVGLGVIGIGVLIVGLVRRLQAPFVIAAIVVTIHALATFSPQIRAIYESVEWWLWLIPGGIIVIVLAARLEKRVADLRGVVRTISALR